MQENKIRKYQRGLNMSVKNLLKRNEITVILAVLILGLFFTMNSSSFLTSYNLFNMGRTAAVYMLIALGQAMVIIVGGMNVSLGYIGGMTVVIAGFLMQNLGCSPIVTIILGLLTGMLAGLINGLIITVLKLNSFVVTLATSFVYEGIINGISQGYPYTEIPKSFSFLGTKSVMGIPIVLFFVIAILLILTYVFKFTVIGRKLLATGGSLEAAKMSGINTNRMLVLANVLSGFFAAMTALVWISRTGSAQPATGGDWMIVSFAVAVIGGTLLKGGVFNPIGLFFAGFLLVMVKNGLVMLNANIYYEQTYLGLILLLAVSLESIRAILDMRKMKRQLQQSK